mmetsp:Transcript_76986/g.120333  ORF Transcript_76986/g.120333 Transcript_76986/m.120333 type:complete len:360 (-) Transcript_76986:51-1130(-)
MAGKFLPHRSGGQAYGKTREPSTLATPAASISSPLLSHTTPPHTPSHVKSKLTPPRTSGRGLPPLSASLPSRHPNSFPARVSRGLPLASKTFSSGFHIRGSQSCIDFNVIPDSVTPSTPSRSRTALPLARKASSKGFLLGIDRSCSGSCVRLEPSIDESAQSVEELARRTWSGFSCHRDHVLNMQEVQKQQRRTATADVRSWAGPFPRLRQRSRSKSVAHDLFGCGSPFWNSLLQALPLQDGGHLAAASRACLAEMRKELLAAGDRSRQCMDCGRMFKYSSCSDECRYHPGKETIVMVVDGPTAGMMDVSWTCCGRGNAYAIGIAVPCTRQEIPGCQQRKHRAKRGVSLEAIGGQSSMA